MTTAQHYDVIIIGTGAGGGTLAHRLAPSGKKVLVLERGAFLPKEKANWSTDAVFRDGRYQTNEVWADKDGNNVNPGIGYWVGGNTKVYGGKGKKELGIAAEAFAGADDLGKASGEDEEQGGSK